MRLERARYGFALADRRIDVGQQVSGIGGVQIGGLARVDDRTAAQRYVAIGVQLLRETRPVQKRRVGGLDMYVGIGDYVQSGRDKRVMRLREDGQASHAA